MELSLWIKILAELLSIGFGLFAFKRRSISFSGLAALILICSSFIFLDHIPLLCILFYMFSSSSLLTKFKKEQKKEFEIVVSKTGPRDYLQAIANLGPACLCMLLFEIYKDEMFLSSFIGSVAAANADSWASEIGGLSKSKPIMITTLKPIEKGISGGITLLGTIGGIAGSAFIVIAAWITLLISGEYNFSIILLIVAFAAGVFGFVLDSFLGATLQAAYRNSTNNSLTEVPQGNVLMKGYRFINNDAVNLITTISAAIFAGLMYKI